MSLRRSARNSVVFSMAGGHSAMARPGSRPYAEGMGEGRPRIPVRRRRLQMGPDERAIREVHSTWIDAVNAGDLVRLLNLMADDVVFLNPGQVPLGRDGFPSGFLAAHQHARINCISELEDVVVVGEVAYTRSRDSLSVRPHAGGEAMELVGHRLTVYR